MLCVCPNATPADLERDRCSDFETLPWYAVRVHARSEVVAANVLRDRGCHSFAPVYHERRRYADSIKTVEKAVFPGYIFCRINLQHKSTVLSSVAVQYLVSCAGVPTPVPDAEIDGLVQALKHGALPSPYLKIGQRVRVDLGSSARVEGVLTRADQDCWLTVSIELLQRAVSLRVAPDLVRPI